MSNPLFDDDSDNPPTPLTPDEQQGLIPTYITLPRELNKAEQLYITAANQCTFSPKQDVLNQTFLRRFHKQMFKDVWQSATELPTPHPGISASIHATSGLCPAI